MILIIKGDLLAAAQINICHQVNCKGVMGGGVAYQIKQKYPLVYNKYKRICSNQELEEIKGGELLGCAIPVTIKENGRIERIVWNLFGQKEYGTDKRYTDYNALAKAMDIMFATIKYSKIYSTVAMPYKIGCGLAGGEWTKVLEIIKELSEKYGIDVYLYKL